MKRAIWLLCVLALMFALCGCTDTTPVSGEESNKFNETLISNADNFKIYELKGEDGILRYRYEVTDNAGNLMEQAMCAEQPKVAQVNATLVGIRFSADGHMFVRYFDVERSLVSQSFKNAFWDNGKLVARNDYDNGHYLIAQDIFDENGFCSKVPVETNSWQITVVATRESVDSSSLTVSYVNGDGGDPDAAVMTIELPIK